MNCLIPHYCCAFLLLLASAASCTSHTPRNMRPGQVADGASRDTQSRPAHQSDGASRALLPDERGSMTKVDAADPATPDGAEPAATGDAGREVSAQSIPPPPSDGRLLINLLMEGSLAWFSWMHQQMWKPKLIVKYMVAGQMLTKTYQHGLNGGQYPQAIFLKRAEQLPGLVEWEFDTGVNGTREEHKHNIKSKGSGPYRVGLIKADISDIPHDATIVSAIAMMHIEHVEGLKLTSAGEGTGRFHHVNKDWDWNHITFTHYAEGKPWSTPIATYPFLGADDIGPAVISLRRQADLAERGYHKNGNRDYPLDLTAYVQSLQQARRMAPNARLD